MPRPLSKTARTKAITAAIDLLAAGGLDAFSVEAVAKWSGVAKTTLYRHWSSSAQLLIEALDAHVERFQDPDTGTLHGDLSQLCHNFREVQEDPHKCQLLMDLLGRVSRDDELATVHQTMVAERTKPLVGIIERAVARGEIPAIDPEVAITFVHGPIVARTVFGVGELTEDEVDQLVTLIVRGLGGTVPGE